VRTAPNYSLLVSALLLSAGCASSPSAPSASRGQEGGAGGTVPAAATQPATASTGAAGDPVSGDAAPAGGGPGAATAAGANGPGQTSDERQAAIDKRLSDSLGSFDAELRTEQQRVAQERDARRAATAGSATAEGQGAEKSADSAGTAATEAPPEDTDKPGTSGRHPGRAKRRDPSGDLKSEKAGKKPDDNAGNGASAREIPDGSDDDVVARRLRQAAQQETDPELKEKLWQEYIDYKKNAQGK
jgi:hypothetical protein